MKKAALFIFAISLFACEKDPDPYSIEGHWVDMTGTFAPEWHFNFQSGLLTQHYIILGATLSTITYPYAIRDSVVFIGGDLNNAPREWTLHFECEDVVEVTQSSDLLGQRFWLKRE